MSDQILIQPTKTTSALTPLLQSQSNIQDDNLHKSVRESMNDHKKKQLGDAVVSVNHLYKEYELKGRKDSVVAIKDITFHENSEIYPVRQGEFVMLRGPSGGGKTTCLNIIGLIDKPTSGEIYIFGKQVTEKTKESVLSRLRLEKMGFVFQTYNLLSTMSAYENVELPMKVLGVLNKKERHDRTIQLLELVGLQDRMNHLPSELSGGEQQRVTIARALANSPELLLMDEPTGDLDTRNTIDVMNLILDLNQKLGTTIIMVTHNPDIECYADRILYLQDGQIIKQVLNTKQFRLDYFAYMKYLQLREQQEENLNKDKVQSNDNQSMNNSFESKRIDEDTTNTLTKESSSSSISSSSDSPQ